MAVRLQFPRDGSERALRAGVLWEFISVSRLSGAYNIRVLGREIQSGVQLGELVRCREVLRSCGKTPSDSSRPRVFVVDRGQALPRRREEPPSVIGIDLLGYVLKMIETEEVF